MTVVISLSETISTISGEGYHRQPAGGELPGRGPQHDEDMHQTLCQHLIINLRLQDQLWAIELAIGCQVNKAGP